MHEMSLAEGVLGVIEDYARKEGFRRVRTVWLEIGQLSGVEAEALRFGFDAVARDTLAADARLEIVAVPGAGRCLACGQAVAVAARYEPCSHCGAYQVEVTGGTEMRVKELEVE